MEEARETQLIQDALTAQILKEAQTKTPEQNSADIRKRIELHQQYVALLNKRNQ